MVKKSHNLVNVVSERSRMQKEIMCIMHIKSQTRVKKISTSAKFYTLIRFLLKQCSMSGLNSITNLQIFR